MRFLAMKYIKNLSGLDKPRISVIIEKKNHLKTTKAIVREKN
jgi:hypothetical protein